MNPYIASRLARDREEELRHRAEIYRLLAEVCRSEPRWRALLSSGLHRWARLVGSSHPPATEHPGLWKRMARWHLRPRRTAQICRVDPGSAELA